jgi:ribosomal protein S12 methylthiotransferase
MPKPAVALVSLGCPKNLVDAEVMMGLLERAGYPLVEEPEQAEVLLVNTCAFIEPAIEEALDALLELADLKRTGRLQALICAGCLTQRGGEELLAQLPEVDLFLAPGAVPRVVEAVEAALAGRRQVMLDPLNYLYCAETPRWRSAPGWTTYVKIADGCDNRCSYCTVPSLRGAYRSRTVQDVVAEVKGLVGWKGRMGGCAAGAAGPHPAPGRGEVREIILIAQDTTDYGRDLAPPASLADLLRALGALDFGGWLRLMYLHPARINETLLAAWAECRALVPYVDVPLQHAAPEVLRRMGRAGSPEAYLELLARIRGYLPEAAIRTTFIVGFPGETEGDFQTLCDFAQVARFDRLSVFRYWPEEGTPAAALPDPVPFEVGDERLEQLMQVQEGISLALNQQFIGRRLRVLVEQVTAESAVGRSYRDAPEVDGQVRIHPAEGLRVGEFVDVTITEAEVHDLVGEKKGSGATFRREK